MPSDHEGELLLEGKVAIITGGSRGLGRQIAGAFAEAGAHVVVASRKKDACDTAAAEIAASTGRQALGVACHVGNWRDVESLTEVAYARFGKVDILVNNAGMSPTYAGLESVSEELFDKVIGVNLKGPFRLCALVGNRMTQDGGGSIINVGSVAAIRATPSELPYAAAKAGLDVLTAGFAQALGPTVRVNSIMAGPFLTDISKSWDMPSFEAAWKRYPLGRAGRPDEVVGAAMYLASNSSSYTTGSVIRVDGGMAVTT